MMAMVVAPASQISSSNMNINMNATTSTIMDAFEARIQFTTKLSKLTASSQAAKACAQFALKHREYHEDLHSCILEQLGSVPLNTRVNLLYFVEFLCEMSPKAGFNGYVDMIKRDLIQIVDSVAPSDGTGAVNIQTVRKVIGNLAEKGFLDLPTMEMIDEMLTERENALDDDLDAESARKRKFDDKIINQRMNEDRERHKRLRENIWAIPHPTAENTHPEFDHMWENTSDLGSDDYEIIREENETRRASVLP